MLKKISGMVIWAVMLFLLVMPMHPPAMAMAQGEPVEVIPSVMLESPPLVVVEPTSGRDWWMLAVMGFAGFISIGALTLAYVAVTGLKDSFPPGTAESWGRLWGALQAQVDKSPSKIDDVAVLIASPLVEALIKLIESKGGGAVVSSVSAPDDDKNGL